MSKRAIISQVDRLGRGAWIQIHRTTAFAPMECPLARGTEKHPVSKALVQHFSFLAATHGAFPDFFQSFCGPWFMNFVNLLLSGFHLIQREIGT